MARVTNQSVRNLILADSIEVRLMTAFENNMYYIVTIHGGKPFCICDTDCLIKFFKHESLAWKFVKRYRDLDQPGLVD